MESIKDLLRDVARRGDKERLVEVALQTIEDIRNQYNAKLEEINTSKRRTLDTGHLYDMSRVNEIQHFTVELFYIQVRAGKSCVYCDALFKDKQWEWLESGQVLVDTGLDRSRFSLILRPCDWTGRWANSSTHPGVYSDELSVEELNYYYARGLFLVTHFPLMRLIAEHASIDKTGSYNQRELKLRALGRKNKLERGGKIVTTVEFFFKDVILAFLDSASIAGNDSKIDQVLNAETHAKMFEYRQNDPQLLH